MPKVTPPIKTVEDDQFTEYASRNHAALKREAEILAAINTIDAHRYLIVSQESQSIVENTVRRHGVVLSESGVAYGRRLVIAKIAPDPTFGDFRNEVPWPPRYCCLKAK
jgi:hypothetical protein